MSQEKNSPAEPSSVLLQAADAGSPAWSDEQDESLHATFRVLRKRKWVIIGCTVAGFVVAAVLCAIWIPKYKATELVELSSQSSSMESSSMSSLASALSGSDDLKTQLQTATTVMQSPSVVLGVIQKLNLPSNKQFLPHRLLGSKSETPAIGPSQSLEDMPSVRDSMVARFTKGLKIEPIADTRLLTISYTSRDPKLSAQIANAVVDEYKKQYLRSHYDASQDASEWLTEQLSGLKAKVQDAEKKLADFQRETGIISVDQMSMGGGGGGKGSSGEKGGGSFSNPVLDKFSMLNNQLTLAELNRVTKEAIYKLAATQDPAVVANLGNSPLVLGGDSAVVMQGGGLNPLVLLEQQQNALKIDREDALTKYGAKNPRLVELSNRISALDGQILEEMKNIAARAKTDYNVAQKVEDGVRKQFNEQQQEANKVNDQAMQLTMLKQETVAQEMLYEDLYTKLQEANIDAGVHASNVTIADVARAPFMPIIPDITLWLAIGFGAGLFLGLSSAFLWENMDRSVISSSQVEAITGGVVFALLPDIAATGAYGYGSRKRAEQKPLDPNSLAPWIVASPNSIISEAIRSLRTSILLLRAEAPPKIISVTSALSGEGKTTVSINLAAAFAQQGSRVLLIEADMRKPKYARLSPNAKSVGLSDILTGRKVLADGVFEYPDLPNLFVLAAGLRPPIPAELLGSARFSELLRQASAEYDFVIVDTPPAILVTDAVIILPKVDCVLCVVRSGVTTRPLLSRVSKLLRRRNGPVVGFVLNRIQTASADYSYYYGYNGRSDYYSEGKSND
jgi:capsular exopolysaccharide synthesis family protein